MGFLLARWQGFSVPEAFCRVLGICRWGLGGVMAEFPALSYFHPGIEALSTGRAEGFSQPIKSYLHFLIAESANSSSLWNPWQDSGTWKVSLN